MSDRLPAIEPSAREIVEATRALIDLLGKGMLEVQMQYTEDGKGLYALSLLEDLSPTGTQALVTAHDNLASALNQACPDAEPIILLTTAAPA